MRSLARQKRTVDSWREMEAKAVELIGLLDMALEEDEHSLEEEIASETAKLASGLEEREFQLIFQSDYDARNALLALHAGAGGTESQDWAQMLMRMYLRWGEQGGYKMEVLEVTPGEQAGIKSAVLEVAGDYAYGYLRSEHGVHRLVRLSPFDADHARHTSFALVEVMPEAEKDVDLVISPEDVRMDTFRASGPGGQHMQKTSTAVRLTHLPTGIVVNYQSERSQSQNREIAQRILHAKLLEMELGKKAQERAKLKGVHVAAGWGNQIRSYVLHPYKMVKDHRTNYQTGDAASVLDGSLDELVKTYLRSKVEAPE